jgi:hypothetical protein
VTLDGCRVDLGIHLVSPVNGRSVKDFLIRCPEIHPVERSLRVAVKVRRGSAVIVKVRIIHTNSLSWVTVIELRRVTGKASLFLHRRREVIRVRQNMPGELLNTHLVCVSGSGEGTYPAFTDMDIGCCHRYSLVHHLSGIAAHLATARTVDLDVLTLSLV